MLYLCSIGPGIASCAEQYASGRSNNFDEFVNFIFP